jgi:hypothetical protein
MVEITDDQLYESFHFFHGLRRDLETGLDDARNRILHIDLARYLQADPNGQGLVFTSLDYHGSSPTIDAEVSPEGRYTDGLSPYELLGSQPVDNIDPEGLFLHDEEYANSLIVTRDWDDIYDSIAGDGSAYLGVQGAATWGGFWGGNVTALPRFAKGMRGVSEGVSEFADDYAEQVMYLPVEGAFVAVGGGLFGKFAAVGQDVQRATNRGSRFASIALRRWRGHHAYPKWMGGDRLQWLVTKAKLPWRLHKKLEREIRQAMREAGLMLPIGGIRGSKQRWLQYFSKNPGEQRRALDVLIRVYKDFDQRNGTPLMKALRRTLRDKRFEFFEYLE